MVGVGWTLEGRSFVVRVGTFDLIARLMRQPTQHPTTQVQAFQFVFRRGAMLLVMVGRRGKKDQLAWVFESRPSCRDDGCGGWR